MLDIEEIHYRNILQEDGVVRDYVIEANRVLNVIRANYGPEISRRSALELHDDIADRLSGILEDLSYYDEVVANYWITIADHDLTRDEIPRTMPGDFLGLDEIGQVPGQYFDE